MWNMNFVSELMISGISEDTGSKITPLQSGIVTMILPEFMIGIACFVFMLKHKSTEVKQKVK